MKSLFIILIVDLKICVKEEKYGKKNFRKRS